MYVFYPPSGGGLNAFEGGAARTDLPTVATVNDLLRALQIRMIIIWFRNNIWNLKRPVWMAAVIALIQPSIRYSKQGRWKIDTIHIDHFDSNVDMINWNTKIKYENYMQFGQIN